MKKKRKTAMSVVVKQEKRGTDVRMAVLKIETANKIRLRS